MWSVFVCVHTTQCAKCKICISRVCCSCACMFVCVQCVFEKGTAALCNVCSIAAVDMYVYVLQSVQCAIDVFHV